MTDFTIRIARPGDGPGAYHVCLKTGDFGRDGEPWFRDDPDALGRVFVGPYLVFEPELSLILEDSGGICGYALGALDSCCFEEGYIALGRVQQDVKGSDGVVALPAGALSPGSQLIMLYAMCGFANFGSLGIMIGGLATMCPERRDDVVSLGLKSIVSGTLSTCILGAVVGMIGG